MNNDFLFPRLMESELEPVTSPVRSTRHMSHVKVNYLRMLEVPAPFTSNEEYCVGFTPMNLYE